MVPRGLRRARYRSRNKVDLPAGSLREKEEEEYSDSSEDSVVVGEYTCCSAELQEPTIIAARKGRLQPEGLGSVGVRALHTRAHVPSPLIEAIPARLGSGADITLISEEYFNLLPDKPPIKKGLHMKLYHLTGLRMISAARQLELMKYSNTP